MEYFWFYFTQDGNAWLCELEDGELSVARRGLFWFWRASSYKGDASGRSLSLHKALLRAESFHREK